MLMFDWNALRVGDAVVVHDPDRADFALVAGAVASVDTRRGANGVAISTTRPGAPAAVLWPSRLTVHRRPGLDTCWRCETLADAHAPTRPRVT